MQTKERLQRAGIWLFVVAVAVFFRTAISAQQAAYTAPSLTDEKSWTLVLLPDPQTYVKFERNQGILELMTAWISENIDRLNIGMVLCTGDLVEHNNILTSDGISGNQSGLNQWRAVSRSIGRLDHKVPYILAAGNHDFGYRNAENRQTFYDDYITADRNHLNEKYLREYFYSEAGVPTLANAAFEWIDPNGIPYLFVNLEFAPRDAVLQWAATTIGHERYQKHRVVVLTHAYMNAQNERIVSANYPVRGNYGQAMWEKLINPSRNVVMVIAGHIGAPDDPRRHLAFKQEPKADGRTVTQMVFNAQALAGGWEGNGGDGWLRYLEFMPNGTTVKVRTFSPFFAISPTTREHAWRREPHDEFEFEIE